MLSVIVAGLKCIFMVLALSSCSVIRSLVKCKILAKIKIIIQFCQMILAVVKVM